MDGTQSYNTADNVKWKLAVVVHACNFSTQEAEAGGSEL
jgi:hypothetical protein